MKKIMKISVFTVIASALVAISCNEDILEIENTNVPIRQLLGDNVALLKGATRSIYKPMQSRGMYSRWQYFLEDLTSDEVTLTINQPPIQRIVDYRLDNTTEANSFYWESCFAGVIAANQFLNNITEVTDINKPFIAEARFLRAHYYFSLVTRFSGVPVNLTGEPVPTPRSTYGETIAQVIQDLQFAAENLPPKGVQAKGRPTQGTAYAYLGKALLFSVEPKDFGNKPETYEEAYKAFDQVEGYSLDSQYVNSFNTAGEYNEESLFEIDFQSGIDAAQANFWSGNLLDNDTSLTFRSAEYSGWGNGQPTATMLDAYEDKASGEKDPRLSETWWMPGDKFGKSSDRIWGEDADAVDGGFGAPAEGTVCSRKFSEYIETDGSIQGSGINYRIIRYADVLLMKAEAALFKIAPNKDEAISLMNEVRARPSVDMPPYPTSEFPCTDIESTFEALVHERRIELAMEGKRTVDLGRWGMDEEVLSPLKPGYNTNKRFFPIPQTELSGNENFGDDNPQ